MSWRLTMKGKVIAVHIRLHNIQYHLGLSQLDNVVTAISGEIGNRFMASYIRETAAILWIYSVSNRCVTSAWTESKNEVKRNIVSLYVPTMQRMLANISISYSSQSPSIYTQRNVETLFWLSLEYDKFNRLNDWLKVSNTMFEFHHLIRK